MSDVSSCATCTGCGACYNICPVKAITMQTDAEGFLYPRIDRDKCVNCGLCYKICPAIHPDFSNKKEPECYAAAASDELRADSTSGAVFPVLAEHILKQGGAVVAAAYQDDFSVRHVVVTTMADLPKLKGSKYLQSDTKKVYSEIKQLLLEQKPVLFVGTPCQVAGLKAFLKKNYALLLTVDIVCHGVPSYQVFRRYLDELTGGEQVVDVNFRDKIYGWKPQLTTTTKTTKSVYEYPAEDSAYMKAFLGNLCLRPSCHKCPFACLPRQGDLTIGDFWGINIYDTKLDDQKGTSLLLVNNHKGSQVIKRLQLQFPMLQKVPLSVSKPGNITLSRSFPPHRNRAMFFANFDTLPLAQNVERCLHGKYDCLILNFWWSINYGAVLTAYALQESLKEMGYNYVATVNNKNEWIIRQYSGSFTQKFADKYLQLTEDCRDLEEFNKLNEFTDTFIVGSDQVFRYDYIQNMLSQYLLGFTAPDKKRISCAASFGLDKFSNIPEAVSKSQKLLQRFDTISVREKSGVEICKETFGLEATQILDPVFLMNPDKYMQIADTATADYHAKVVTYVLDRTPEQEELFSHYGQKLKADVVHLCNSGVEVENYLAAIRDCKFFITDSFHGACFAIIFNKPFICLTNNKRGNSRLESLFAMFKIENHSFSSTAEAIKAPSPQVDWSVVNKILQKQKQFSLNWLREAMVSPKQLNMQMLMNEIAFLNEKVQIHHTEKPQEKLTQPKYSVSERIFSLKNIKTKEQRYKILTLLGLRFCIKKGKKA